MLAFFFFLLGEEEVLQNSRYFFFYKHIYHPLMIIIISIFMLIWLHSCHFNSRLTYSDLCLRIPDSKFRLCLLRTLAVLFDLMCSYHEIMDFELERKVISGSSDALKRISFSIYMPSHLCFVHPSIQVILFI